MTRAPESVRTAIAPLSRLPAFFDLKGKRVIVAGGSDAAAWKVELLSAAGARVEVFAAIPGDPLLALAITPPNGAVSLHRRSLSASDLRGAAIAVADCAVARDVEVALREDGRLDALQYVGHACPRVVRRAREPAPDACVDRVAGQQSGRDERGGPARDECFKKVSPVSHLASVF